MKLRSIITTAAVSAFMLTSCLKKTDRLGYISDKGSIVSEIATVNVANPYITSVEPLPATETIDLLKLAMHNAKNIPSGDIKIKLALKPSLIDDYNAANGVNYLPLPFNAYSLSDPTLEVTIPKGTYGDHQITMNLTKANLSLTETYAIGFTITSVSEGVISDLARDFLFIIGVKNKYDGFYQITSGTCVDANGAYTGYYPGSLYYDATDPRYYSLTTNGPTTGLFYDEWFPYPNYIVQNISTGGYANTGLRPLIGFDATTDKVVSVVNYNNTAQVMTVGSNSKFNNSDHSIDLDWTLGRWHVTEHWKFIRPR